MKGAGKKKSSSKKTQSKSIKPIVIFSVITFLIVILDQIIKYLASNKVPLGESIPFAEGIFHFTHVQNFGAGFSILQGHTWLFILVALFFIVMIIANFNKIPKDMHTQLGFSLLLGGTISNLIDRVVFGYVIDYFEFIIFNFSNNIADIAITLGALMIIAYFIIKKN